ncbi:MAG: preprotein translocase subunit SecG [Candidatus Doudnabacteria bacterium]|nr:preprotein translocase subunit SecG [Candidatus Doudnabacteria bacterium]
MDNLENILLFGLIAIDAILVIVILMQQKEGGLSTVFGGEGGVYRSRRGFAKGLHYMTIILGVIFVALNIAILFLL